MDYQHHSPSWSFEIDMGGGYVVKKGIIGPQFTEEAVRDEIKRQQNLVGANGLPMMQRGEIKNIKPRDRFKPLPPIVTMPMAMQLAQAPGVELLGDDDE